MFLGKYLSLILSSGLYFYPLHFLLFIPLPPLLTLFLFFFPWIYLSSSIFSTFSPLLSLSISLSLSLSLFCLLSSPPCHLSPVLSLIPALSSPSSPFSLFLPLCLGLCMSISLSLSLSPSLPLPPSLPPSQGSPHNTRFPIISSKGRVTSGDPRSGGDETDLPGKNTHNSTIICDCLWWPPG